MQQATEQLLSARLARAQVDGRLPSLVAGLIRGSELVWSGAHGNVVAEGSPDLPGPDTQYRIGSITKTFAAVEIMRLRDEGRLDLGDLVDAHLPDASVAAADPVDRGATGQVPQALPGATIAQLLAHTSGAPSETGGLWWERTAGGDHAELVATTLPPGAARTPPGRRFHYSNSGFGLLGEIIARHRGAPWRDVLQTQLLDPLGLTRTSTRPQRPAAQGFAIHPWADLLLAEPEHDHGAMAPAGQLWSTVNDLAKWAAFLGGDTAGLLSASTLDEMLEPQAIAEVRSGAWTGVHGLGIQLWNDNGDRTHGHGGSMPGFLALLRTHRDGDGAVVFANGTTGLDPALGTDLLAILAAHEPVIAGAWTPSPVAPDALPLLGIWFWGAMPHALRAIAGGLLELAPLSGRGRASRFRPIDFERWLGLDNYYAGEALVVTRRADGSVEHLNLGSFVFTREPYEPDAGVPGGVDPTGWHAP